MAAAATAAAAAAAAHLHCPRTVALQLLVLPLFAFLARLRNEVAAVRLTDGARQERLSKQRCQGVCSSGGGGGE